MERAKFNCRMLFHTLFLQRSRQSPVTQSHEMPMSERSRRHPSETGLGFTSIKAREAWKHRQARLSVGLPPEELPINAARDYLEVTLSYAAEPPVMTRKMLQETRRKENFEQLQQQKRQSEQGFVDMGTRLAVREDQDFVSRSVEGPSRRLMKETTRLDNRQHLLCTWQPNLDAKYDASERMAHPVPEDRM